MIALRFLEWCGFLKGHLILKGCIRKLSGWIDG